MTAYSRSFINDIPGKAGGLSAKPSRPAMSRQKSPVYANPLSLMAGERSREQFIRMRYRNMLFNFMFRAAYITAVSLSLVFMYDFFTQWHFFKAEHIIVKGAVRLSEAEILQQAQLSSYKEKNINILSVNLSGVRKRLLAHTWIAQARVRREFPSKIHIEITEHAALAVVDLGLKFIINADGEIFKEWSVSEDRDILPLITGLAPSDTDDAGKLSGRAFQAVMEILRLGQQPGIIIPNRLIKEIRADREMGITLQVAFSPEFGTGWLLPADYRNTAIRLNEIRMGYSNYPEKYGGLKNVLFYMGEKQQFVNIDSVDLNNLNRIVVELRGER
ncbi:MAG: hypothetical protein BWK80_31360 [Desulfobacteraceae bacterium IS3]|nr:MAG: hypothetical protein BWK80_31360 [Desulfobacteraceae bacterium IS3]